MAMLTARNHRPRTSLVGRGSGLLLLVLGVTILGVLFWATGGHRARLVAETLGVLVGGSMTILFVGVSRPSPQVVTRAYVRLSRNTRALLIAGIAMVLGFAVVTAAIEPAIPRLREIPAFGGVVTLDWVLSLTVLAIAGTTLLLLGMVTIGARPAATPRAESMATDFLLERLARASNGNAPHALRACFTHDEAGECSFRAWCALLATYEGSHVVLVRSATVWDRLWSEWHLRAEQGGHVQRWILVAQAAEGCIANVEVFRQQVPAGDEATRPMQPCGVEQ